MKRAGVPYADALNRKADFHALRYTFTTNLSKAGVLPREAMELLRHSDMRLTMKTYTDSGLLATGEAVSKLPAFASTTNGATLTGPQTTFQSAQIDTQTPDFLGQPLARSGTGAILPRDHQSVGNEPSVRFYDTGHFALETHHAQIAADIAAFLQRALAPRLN